MRLTMQRYRKARKNVKQQILNEFCETTGYSRGYARFILRNHGRQVWRCGKRQRRRFYVGLCHRAGTK